MMGLFDFLKNRKTRQNNLKLLRMLNGTYPVFSQFGADIYASDVVQQAIYTIVTEMKKLKPRHVRRTDFDLTPVYDDVQRVLDQPNVIMTRSDFIEKITWQVLLNYNCFIYIQRDRNTGRVTGLYPLSPAEITFLESAGQLYVQMRFRSGESYTLPYQSFIHIKLHYSVNDLMGGGENGQPDNQALLETLRLNHTLLEGIKKALHSSFAVNGIVKYNTMLDGDRMQAEISAFEDKLTRSKSGILGIDNKSEYIPLKRDIALVDEATLKFLDDKILRNYGVPLCILRGDYTTEQYEAFYQRTLEPLIINFSEAFTRGLFTDRELGFNNEIIFYPKELIFMNTTQTIQMVNLLGQSGTLFENEKREAFGLPPLEELQGVRLQSLNYVDVSIAKDYQLGLYQGEPRKAEPEESPGDEE